jgi:SAM-dependent methyltransferase
MTPLDPTGRFTDRVADYVRARPDYPATMLQWLHATFGIDATWSVADIGAGTGISSKLFLDAGHRVVAVEPNAAMRAAATDWLGTNPTFQATDGMAENTHLANGSVDLVSAAQAFHWFDRDAVAREWSRILTPRGLAAVYWNTRKRDGSPFLRGYEEILRRHDADYAQISAAHPDDATMRAWFGDGLVGAAAFPHAQSLDWDGLIARTMSSSHSPKPGHPQHEPMLADLRALFAATQTSGEIELLYDTRIFVGKPSH